MVKLDFTAALFLLAALLLLALPIKWIVAVTVSIILHESCHILALKLMKQPVCRMRFHVLGASLETGNMLPWKELICALAGPASCLPALLFARWMPRVAVCSLFHSAYNLLPIGDLDGGRAMRCLAKMVLPERLAVRLCALLEKLAIMGIFFAGSYGTFCLGLGILPICIAGFLLMKGTRRKTPCKGRDF